MTFDELIQNQVHVLSRPGICIFKIPCFPGFL